MKLAKSFEQGVIVLAMLTTQEPNHPLRAQSIHQHMEVRHRSLTYTKKILRKLVVSGLIQSIPGSNGGYILADDPKHIQLSDIVEALEGPIDTYTARDTLTSLFPHAGKKADYEVHQSFVEADKAWMAVLENVSLLDIVQRTIGVYIIPTIDWNKEGADSLFNKIATYERNYK